MDGRDVWVIAGTPKAGYHATGSGGQGATQDTREALWVDKSNYQWVRLEADTDDTISFGLFLARLYPGAKLVFEQTRAADDLWLPKRIYMKGAGRLGIIKRIAMDEEITWSNYRKFQVDSKIVPVRMTYELAMPTAGGCPTRSYSPYSLRALSRSTNLASSRARLREISPSFTVLFSAMASAWRALCDAIQPDSSHPISSE